MKKLTQHEYDVRLQEIRERNEMRERKRKLRDERRKGWNKPKLPATSKLAMAAIFLICIEIIAYAEVIMWVHFDTSALYVLVGVPAALLGSYFSYCQVCRTDHSQGGITYELAMRDVEQNESAANLEVDPEPIEATEVDDSDAVG